MTTAQADEPVWRYWYGRALAAAGNKKAATQYYESIADKLDFYGQLANEELGRHVYIPPEPPLVEPAQIRQIRGQPGLQQAIPLFDLGLRPQAVPEGNYALPRLST